MDRLIDLLRRYPALEFCVKDIQTAFECFKSTFNSGGKLLIAGNGGSAADSEHIVGELMKSFLRKRKIRTDFAVSLSNFGKDGIVLADRLEGSLPAISLASFPILSSAFLNDNDPYLTFAQIISGIGNPHDAYLGISTSGNSRNITYAAIAAKAKGVKTVGLTGCSGGRMNDIFDVVVRVPENETAKIQELHLPVYHTLCAMLEDEFFPDDKIR